MKPNESSVTSLITAFSRAYHSKFDTPKVFNDFIATELIPEPEFTDISKNLIKGFQFFNPNTAEKFQSNQEEFLKWITQVQLSPTPLARAAYCEDVLKNEIRLGVNQYVVLGAGMDTYGLRQPVSEGKLTIYEVDHPSTQEFKKKRLEQARLEIPDNLHFVSMDFTKPFSYEILFEQGFEFKKTFFSLLGVSYYLTKEELSDLFNNLFSDVPTGSSIVFDYGDETLFEEKGMDYRVENMVKMANASGEPMKSCFTYHEIESMLEKSGLLIYEHISPPTINDRYFSNRTDYLRAFETIHYIHAVKK